ncbi:Uncharacterised protein [Shewanella putrefaciens]|nr:Uncharacterised protein [Shewanella putrefaciens]
MKFKIYIASVISSFIFCSYVEASIPIPTQVCNDCSALAMEQKAESSVQRFGHSYVMVIDIKNEVARKYSVVIDEDRLGEPVYQTYEVAINSEEQNDVEAVYLYREELVKVIQQAEQKSKNNLQYVEKTVSNTASSDDVEYKKTGTIDVKGSPYDFMSASYVRNDIWDYYFEGATSVLTSIMSSSFNTVQIPMIKDLDVYLTINFYNDLDKQFKNGFLSVTINNTTKSFDVLGGRDGFNNSIPLIKSQLYGKFAFGNGSGEKAKFETYSYTLMGGSSGSGGCTYQVVASQKFGDRYVYTYACK